MKSSVNSFIENKDKDFENKDNILECFLSSNQKNFRKIKYNIYNPEKIILIFRMLVFKDKIRGSNKFKRY